MAAPSYVQRGPLTPATDSSINATHNVREDCKKRKRDQNDLRDLLQRSFVIHAHQHSALPRAQTLSPILLLPRAELPLSYLEPTTSNPPFSSPRLFSASIPALDTLGVAKQGAIVLIAKLEREQSLYAVESVALRTYAICKLGIWVNIEDLRAAALVTRNDSWVTWQDHGSPERGTEWWKPAILEEDREKTQRAKRSRLMKSNGVLLLMKQSQCKGPQQSPISPSPLLPPSQVVPHVELAHAPDVLSHPPMAGPTAQETREIIRTQYLEALHLSKTSLAYFAKGPLSRARAAFSAENGTTMPLVDLIHSLRTSILTLPTMDKKYRETVPNLVKALPVDNLSGDEGPQPTLPEPHKKRKSRKIKPDKNGLHPNEEDYLSRGWRTSDHDTHEALPYETSDEYMNRRILRLRVRETELQIILILETLALESSGSSSKSQLNSGAVDPVEAVEKDPRQLIKDKPKKLQDLTLLLDMLIDRLCIWQSVSIEESGSTSPRPSNNRKKLSSLDGRNSAKQSVQNGLRDFCAEVVVPFYASRLPSQCAMINRKLGGRSGPSPTRPSLTKSISTLTRPPSCTGTAPNQNDVPNVRPMSDLNGEIADRQPRPPSQRPPPMLVRSATAPAIPGLKREGSEKPLSAIPSKEPQTRPGSRAGALKAKRFTQREVDLSAVSSANEVKLKRKKAIVEDELKHAITALKRPNRGLAGREFVDSAERRALAKNTGGKKAKSVPVRNPFAPGIQVTATPKGQRKKNIVGMPSTVLVEETNPLEASQGLLPSSGSCIPQSTMRVPEATLLPSGETRGSPLLVHSNRQHLLAIVQETPSRRLSKSGGYASSTQLAVPRARIKPGLQETPTDVTTNDTSRISQAPVLVSERVLIDNSSPLQLQILETPCKRAQLSASLPASKVVPAVARKADGVAKLAQVKAPSLGFAPSTEHENRSIYESLGWDDADDDADDLI